MIQIQLPLEMGERTCASEPGTFCRMVRTQSFGRKFTCALYETKLFDEDGWLMRCSACLKELQPAKVWKPSEIASLVHVHVRTIERALREGALKGFKAGRQWRIRDEDLQEWMS